MTLTRTRTFQYLFTLILITTAVVAMLALPSPTRAEGTYSQTLLTHSMGILEDASSCTATSDKDHWSEARYNYQSSPKQFQVKEVNYKVRKTNLSPMPPYRQESGDQEWRHEKTEYWEWNSPDWDLVAWVSAGSWLTSGSGCSTLSSNQHIGNDFNLDNGGLVTNYINWRWMYCDTGGCEQFNLIPDEHQHWLQDQ